RLAHHALREHAARHADLDALALEDLGRVRTVRGDELAAERVAAKVVRKSLAALAQPRELRAPLPDQPILVLLPVAHPLTVRLTLQALLQARLEELVDVAVEDRVRLAHLDAGPQILHARLIEHVRADLAAPADVRLAFLDQRGLLAPFLLLELVELRLEL